jgi:DNA-binding transcriptional LysR family regulator
MRRDEFTEMRAFLEVARERSFTRAAAKLGVTRSALSHTIRAFEERLGVRLLARTTRDVAPTPAGERLVERIAPHFEGIAAEISAIGALRDMPSGNVRIVCPDDAVEMVFRPRLPAFLHEYPDVNVELIIDNGFTNIVEKQFDAGVRLGELVARDMVAVRIGPDVCYAVVGSPAYFASRSEPATPQDLADHNCVNLRLPTSGGLYAWEFEKDSREFSVRVNGQLTMSNIDPAINSAIDGVGLAYAPRDLVLQHLRTGRLREVLEDWTPTFQGYHLYYPSRRNPSPAFAAFVEAFRHRIETGYHDRGRSS